VTDRIVTLHIKNSKRNDGGFVRSAKATRRSSVLALLRDRQWAIPTNIEYE
jgi:hypothetical protein